MWPNLKKLQNREGPRDQQECKSLASMGLNGQGSGIPFKLSVLFLDLPRAMLLPPPIQLISQIFQGVLPLSYLGFFLNFPKFFLLPFMVTILAPTAHASWFCLLIWLLLGMCLVEGTSPCAILASTAHAPSKGISPYPPPPQPLLPPPPHQAIQTNRLVVHQGDWKARPSSLLGGTQRHQSPLEGSEAVPWSVWGAVIS